MKTTHKGTPKRTERGPLRADWKLGELVCQLTNFVNAMAVGVVVYTLMAIAIDRCAAFSCARVCEHFRF